MKQAKYVNLIGGHVFFFEHIQGVPHQLVYDNMGVAVRRFVGKTEKEPTNCLLGMSMYYQYKFRFCNVRRGNEKGHVERSVEYVRRKAFGLKDEFADEKSANAHLQNILKNLNGRLQKEKGFSGTIMLAEGRHSTNPIFFPPSSRPIFVSKYKI